MMVMRFLSYMFAVLMLIVPLSTSATSAASNPALDQQLGKVRQVTAKYHDVEQALADGYVAPTHCYPGMGYHYIHPQRAADFALNPLQPELLLYERVGGRLRLVAVEYFVPYVGQARPEIMGVPFDGPMAGHEPGMPEHYDLHVWVWRHNPDGMFTAYNPRISCDAAHDSH